MGKIYACKLDGKCDVSKKNRKKCQKCRYEACLAAGMDPGNPLAHLESKSPEFFNHLFPYLGLVLNEDQKKARFRKSLEKKSEPRSGSEIESDGFEGFQMDSDPQVQGIYQS